MREFLATEVAGRQLAFLSMAKKKPRTPDPPRKVQAPKVRQKHQAPSRGVAMPGTNMLIGAALLVASALVVGWFGFFSGGGTHGSAANVTRRQVQKVTTAMAAAGCSFKSAPGGQDQEHMHERRTSTSPTRRSPPRAASTTR